MVYENGSVYEGDWQYDLRHGRGKYMLNHGQGRGNNWIMYSGQWENDKPQGKGKLEIPDADYVYDGKKGERDR